MEGNEAGQNKMERHPEMNLKNYRKILEEYGLEWSSSSIENADIDGLDSRGLLALLVSAFRADHFSNGYFETLVEKGLVQKWLVRLKQLDAEDETL